MKEVYFWYAVKNISQTNFMGGSSIVPEFVGDGHIVYQEMLMCGRSREALQREYKADRATKRNVRIQGHPLCKDCEEKYRSHPALSWARWTRVAEEN